MTLNIAFVFFAGLFPLFSSAAMNVRSALLTVYETHFVPLGPRLRPGLNGFLSGILAGLEEGSDHLERYVFPYNYMFLSWLGYVSVQYLSQLISLVMIGSCSKEPDFLGIPQ